MSIMLRKDYIHYEESKGHVVRVARELGTFTPKQIRARLPDVSTSAIQRAITELCSEGVIEDVTTHKSRPRLLQIADSPEVMP